MMLESKREVTILGAGLVGSLMAIYLSKKGYKVSVYEKRSDLRANNGDEGRSINLALSSRGWRALEEVQVLDKVREIAIPMKGRMMHNLNGSLSFQPYGKEGEAIYSVSRGLLNEVLTTEAEKCGSRFYFHHLCKQVNLEKCELLIEDVSKGTSKIVKTGLIIGADGAFSILRASMQNIQGFESAIHVIEHGYKELTIPPDAENQFALDKHALHIWPRKQYMLIALPNPDKTFTCTLFYQLKGEGSFEDLTTPEKVKDYFKKNFPDAYSLMPGLEENFFRNPTATLAMVKCFPWVHEDKAVLIGDASHAILPFFGQGMNSGFEDCRIFNELIDKYDGNWKIILNEFQKIRKPDTDAIASLALENFLEMRDLVADPQFLLRKKIEARIHQLYPGQWLPLYSMVTFSHMPYSEARAIGKIQESIMNDVMKIPDIESTWENIDYRFVIDKLERSTPSH